MSLACRDQPVTTERLFSNRKDVYSMGPLHLSRFLEKILGQEEQIRQREVVRGELRPGRLDHVLCRDQYGSDLHWRWVARAFFLSFRWRKTTCADGASINLISAYGDIDWQAHHAARLVFANLPLTIGLASKNNVISYMTGFSYESLNVLHRWSARMILILSYIHVGGRVYVNVPSTDPSFSLAGQAYVRWGIMALVAMTWMILVASRLFRNYLYQLFIIQHVSLFLISMVGLWLHRPAVAPWIWVGLIIWGFDRIVRTFRIVWRHTFVKAGQMEDGDEMDENQKTALVEILNADTLRVTVKTTMCWIPGKPPSNPFHPFGSNLTLHYTRLFNNRTAHLSPCPLPLSRRASFLDRFDPSTPYTVRQLSSQGSETADDHPRAQRGDKEAVRTHRKGRILGSRKGPGRRPRFPSKSARFFIDFLT